MISQGYSSARRASNTALHTLSIKGGAIDPAFHVLNSVPDWPT